MAGDLDHILGGVGARRGEESDDHLVHRVAFGIGKFGQRGGPGFPLVFARKSQTFVREIARACVPEMRTMPMPPRPGGVEIAAIVSLRRKG